ncbi:hypothetical protein P1X15_07145 [Runella sp. MFBS21]|uniref:hypothetical protein n=1 Tax=Runella sp. MFBS21 TaxID=3034018 RepID=UPI0023F6A228|nr:hypothetical protein [Runella sp. MFBS21]MDF7817362.1 hypothetical protein [Runella sp. MFBS21]
MNNEKVVKIHANDKQIKFLRSRANRKSFIGGRASGKSTVLGFVVGKLFNDFPRAKWVVGGLTYVQLDLIVLPAIREALGFMGYSEYHPKQNPAGVYVVGIRPPDHWTTPYKKVGRLGYQYCLSFINGFTLQFCSQDRAETHRGLSIDGVLIDESATISSDFVRKVLLPARRGNNYAPWANHPWNKGFFDFSSASWTQEGMWIYETEEHYNAMIEQRSRLTSDELKAIPPKFLFLESTFRDNAAVLPPDFEQQLRDQLDPLEYAVEVENERMGKLPNSFYYGFNPERHCYTKSYDYIPDEKTGILLYRSNDYETDKPLDYSLDFNADIVWGVVGQDTGKTLKVIHSHYEKVTPSEKKNLKDQKNSLIEKQAKWFCETYKNHEKKEVFIYGDPGGNSTSAATKVDNRPFFDQICDILIKEGWVIYRRELTSYPSHKDKYHLINMLFEESNPRAPHIAINKLTNKVLIINLTQTPVTTDKTYKKARRIGKDKSSERSTKNREYATDGTDALDYWLWVKCKKYLSNHAPRKNHLFVFSGR